MTNSVYISGSGTYLPGDPIPFKSIGAVLGEVPQAPPQIQRWLKSTDSMMHKLLDIEYVHYAMDPTTREFTDDNVSMAVKAANQAIDAAKIRPDQIDLICYGSAHQDQMPTASTMIQQELGIEKCTEFSIHANCTSAYKALYLAHQLIRSGRNDNALVVSASISSSELRAEYYNQQLLDKESLFLRWFLCDGAGALVLTRTPQKHSSFQVEATYVESIGGKRPSLMFNKRPALWLNPKEEYEKGLHHLRQKFRNALSSGLFQEKNGSVFFNGLKRMLEKENIPADKIRFFQVNMPTKHIIESILDECEALGIPKKSLFTKLDKLGYCGPPMGLICLDKIIREESLEKGDRVLSFVTEVSKFMQAGYSIKYVGQP
ncbi:MAG: 3-oxoacyl-ACP synthase III family protein [Pseudomonadota bacterium]